MPLPLAWAKLTRNGMPEFRVSNRNRPLTLSGKVFPVGAKVGLGDVQDRMRLRLFYQQRIVEVVPGTVAGPTQQERLLAIHQANARDMSRPLVEIRQELAKQDAVLAAATAARTGQPRRRTIGEPVTVPVTVVKVADLTVGLPSVSVPVEEEPQETGEPAARTGYRPRGKRAVGVAVE